MVQGDYCLQYVQQHAWWEWEKSVTVTRRVIKALCNVSTYEQPPQSKYSWSRNSPQAKPHTNYTTRSLC